MSDYLATLWLKDQFDSLHREHLLILKKLDELAPSTISLALEEQVRKAAGLATSIDRKVPDISPG